MATIRSVTCDDCVDVDTAGVYIVCDISMATDTLVYIVCDISMATDTLVYIMCDMSRATL